MLRSRIQDLSVNHVIAAVSNLSLGPRIQADTPNMTLKAINDEKVLPRRSQLLIIKFN